MHRLLENSVTNVVCKSTKGLQILHKIISFAYKSLFYYTYKRIDLASNYSSILKFNIIIILK